jgi:hypothetical protein
MELHVLKYGNNNSLLAKGRKKTAGTKQTARSSMNFTENILDLTARSVFYSKQRGTKTLLIA